jgi:hypothetical protein
MGIGSTLSKGLLLLVLLLSQAVVMSTVAAQAGYIDVFTQKAPFDGRGPHASSDAFHPGEKVVVNALVEYNDMPVKDALVTFHVAGPEGLLQIVFSRVAETNESGVASIGFTIPSVENGSTIFGNWTVQGYVQLEDWEYTDLLTFRVDWIVKIVSLRIIDNDLVDRTKLGKDSDVGVEITLQSISMSKKKATVALVIQDEINVPVAFLNLKELWIQPNETTVRLYAVLHLPKWAVLGKATLYASVLTASPSLGGVPYSPGVETSFDIARVEPIEIHFHDVAVIEVSSSKSQVNVGEIVRLNLTVRNEGTEVESFELDLYYDSELIQSLSVESLTPYAQSQLSLNWNTSLLVPGNYTLHASIPPLTNETETIDNVYTDGTIQIKTSVIITHDIAVVSLALSPTLAYVGDPVSVAVTIRNKGTQAEVFNLSTYYDSMNLLNTLPVAAILPNKEKTLRFNWDTSGLSPGTYAVSAWAHPVAGEVEVFDNFLLGGNVTLLGPMPEVVHDVAVAGVTASPGVVTVGEAVTVEVVVKNEGTQVETFNVSAYFDESRIATSLVVSLASEGELTVTFVWDTSGLSPGTYTIKARAHSVKGETNLENNEFENGEVHIVTEPAPPFPPLWLSLLLIIILLLFILFIILALLYRRRKRRDLSAPFNKAWEAWYGRSPVSHSD